MNPSVCYGIVEGVSDDRKLPLRRRIAPGVALAAVLVALLAIAARPADPGVPEPDRLDDGGRPLARITSDHFVVHHALAGSDQATPEYAQLVSTTLEQALDALVGHGWPAPVDDGALGGDERLDVYLLEVDGDAFGYAQPEGDLCRICTVPSHLVLDNDYADFGIAPEDALRATAAHELGHSLQLAATGDSEAWIGEATSVWLEELVFPDADARSAYLDDFAAHPDLPITRFEEDDGSADRSYGAWVFVRWIADRHGPGLWAESWRLAGRDDVEVLAALDRVLEQRGSGLAEEFTAFTFTTAAWEAGLRGDATSYPALARGPALPSGGQRLAEVDHLASYVVDVPVSRSKITVTIRGPKLIESAAALVVRRGRQVEVIRDSLFDGRAQLEAGDIGDAHRVTIVIVNADATLSTDRRPGALEARYLYDDVIFAVGVDRDPGLPPKTS